jgi:hypothetical protein
LQHGASQIGGRRFRYDRLAVIIDARTTLATSVICFRILYHDDP